MAIQIAIIERRDDGSEVGRGLCEFVSIPGPGDQIFVTRTAFTDQMRVIAINHYPLEPSSDIQARINGEPRIKVLAELISTYPN